MSYDLRIATSRRPDLAGAARPGAARWSTDGPHAIDPDDLDEPLAAAVLAPRWLVEISVPAGAPKKEAREATAAAREIAERFEGAIYDPQVGAVVWPRGKQARFQAPAAEQRIRLVQLEWFLPVAAGETPGAARALLATLRRRLAEAMPRRFGPFEPLEGRLDRDGDEAFAGAWARAAAVEHGETLFWKAASPCFGGAASFPDRRERFRPAGAGRAVRLSTSLDGRALHGDPRWREAAVDLFVALARRLEAFYAAGYVERRVIARRGAVWYDGESESVGLQRSRWWLGCPRVPTWLAWFGGPLAARLGSLPGARPLPGGLLFRAGNEPLDRDELSGRFLALPADILAPARDAGD